MAFPLHASEICEIWDGKRKICFSPSQIVTFLPVQKSLVPAGPKCDIFREGCDKKRQKLKKKFVRESVTFFPERWQMWRDTFFVTEKKWQMWRHSPKSEMGSWEEIRVRPTLILNVEWRSWSFSSSCCMARLFPTWRMLDSSVGPTLCLPSDPKLPYPPECRLPHSPVRLDALLLWRRRLLPCALALPPPSHRWYPSTPSPS